MKRRIVPRTPSFLLLIAAWGSPLAARQPAEWPIAAATADLARGNSAATIALLEPWLANPGSLDAAQKPLAIEALLLRARAREQKGEDGTAALADLATADSLGPDRPHAAQIALVRARIHDRLKQRDQALAAARSAADLLLDPARRRERAQVWLDAADVFLKPPADLDPAAKKNFQPNRALAVELLGIALETGALGADVRRIEIERLSLMSRGEMPAEQRIARAKELLAKHPDAPSAERAKLLTVISQAAIETLSIAEMVAAARSLSAVPDARDAAIEAWYAIVAPEQKWLPGDELFALIQEAATELARLQATPERLETAYLRIADAADQRGDPSRRIEAATAARRARPDSPRTAEIEIQIATAKASHQGFDAAISHLEGFLAGRTIDAAGSAVTAHLRQLLLSHANALFEVAGSKKGDERLRAIALARAAYDLYLARFPGDDELATIMLSQARLARLEPNLDAALAQFGELRTRFPNTEEARSAWMESAAILFEDKKDAKAALALLELAASAEPDLAGIVKEFQDRIERPELSFETLRPFRSDEPKRIPLTRRNIEKVEVSIYPVDLTEFFLATGRFDVLQALDVSLIEPLRRIEVANGNAESHIAATEAIDVGELPPAKAYILAARGGDLEARAIVMTTDLDAAVIRTASEWRVFGIDRKSGAKVEIARYRVASASGVLLPADAVLPKDLTSDQLSVLASAELGFAAIAVESRAPRAARTQPSVTLTVDRTPVRPGEDVHVFGRIVDAHRAPLAESLELLLVDVSSKQNLLKLEVRSDERGAFGAALPIDGGLIGGNRDLRVELWRGQGLERRLIAAERCSVDDRTEPETVSAFLAVEPLLEGEAGTVLITARNVLGQPIPDLPLTIALDQEPEQSVRTDAQGAARLEIPAAHTRERARCRLAVRSPTRSYAFEFEVALRAPELLITRGLGKEHLVGRAVRPRLLLTAEGRPVAAKIDYQLRRSFAGEWLSAGSGNVVTTADGVAEPAIELREPGYYDLTFTWPDEHGAPRRTVHEFWVHAVGAYPDLALCPEQGRVRPGETFELPVFWPFAAGPALLTVFGADLDRAEVITLNPGNNVLSITAPKSQATTCEITLSALWDSNQTRRLTLGYAPSLDLAITTPTTDAQGNLRFEVTGKAGTNPGSGALDYVVAEVDEIEALRAALVRVTNPDDSQIRAEAPGVIVGLSADLMIDPIQLATDPKIAEQLAAMNRAESDTAAKPMVQNLELDDMIAMRRIPGEVAREEVPELSVTGGGPSGVYRGAGDGLGKGKYGGRGRASRSAPAPLPLAVGFARSLDASGRLTIELPAPSRAGAFALLVISRDGIASASAGRSFVVPPERVVPVAQARAARPRFDGFALSNGGALVLPAAARADLTTVTAFASALGALAATDLPGGASDLDVAIQQCLTSSETMLLAQAMKLDAAALAPHAARRDRAFDHLRAVLLGVAKRGHGLENESSMAARRGAAILFALATARRAGANSPAGFEDPWIAALERMLTSDSTPPRRALALAALARAGTVSFERLNRAIRDADSLSRRDVSLLILALLDANRPDEARTLAGKLAARTAPDAVFELSTFEEPLTSQVEIDALVVAVLRRTLPDRALPPAIATLFAGTRATRLDEAGGAFAIWQAAQPIRATNFTLRLRSGEKTIEVAIDAGDPRQEIELLDRIRSLPPGDVTFERADSAPFALAYATAEHRAVAESRFTVDARVVRVEAKREGQLVPVGNSILAESNTPEAPHTKELGVGRAYEMRIAITRNPGAPRGYWVRVPIPEGLALIPGSVSYADEHVVEGDSILLHHAATDSNIARRHLMFRVIPTMPRAAVPPLTVGIRTGRFEPEFAAVSANGGFDVVPWDRDVDAAIEPTPDERLRAGLLASAGEVTDRARQQRAYDWLSPLLTRKLETNAMRNVLRAALRSVIALDKDREIVDLFELSKERDPDNVLSFDAMNRVSKAYAAIGEIERAREVLSAIGDALFLQEARAVGRLESAGLERIAMTFLDRLLVEHDATTTVLETTFAVGQHAYDLARQLGSAPPKVLVLGQKPYGRSDWLALGKRALEGRLVASGSDPAAEEVTLTLGNLLLEAGSLDDASALANAARTRYANGRFGATWHYVLAYAALARRDLTAAATEAQALVDSALASSEAAIRKLEATGNHMLAQIAHSNGDLAKARQLYAKVKDQIVDARLALEYLERSGLSLPTVWVSGVEQALEIPLERKALESQRGEVEVTLYPVDLRLLYLKKRGFGTLSSVELAGLPATSRSRVKPVADKARGTELVSLGKPAPGAYLVIVREGDLLARSLAIVSDITIDVVEIAGGARAHVVDRLTRKPIPDVVLTFVGSESAEFVTRKSDLRGIAEANGLRGSLAVIAQREKQFAYYQGATVLSSESHDPKQQAGEDSEVQDQADKQLEDARALNEVNYKANFNRAQLGVEVQRANKK